MGRIALTGSPVDDTSPLISYAPTDAWAHTSGTDAQAYLNQTYSSTTLEGATASFTFNGTGFWIYGAKKPSYGASVLLVDTQVVSYDNCSAPEDQFNQLLAGTSGLQDGQHVVTFMAGGEMDIDAVKVETSTQEEEQAEFQALYVLSSHDIHGPSPHLP